MQTSLGPWLQIASDHKDRMGMGNSVQAEEGLGEAETPIDSSQILWSCQSSPSTEKAERKRLGSAMLTNCDWQERKYLLFFPIIISDLSIM